MNDQEVVTALAVLTQEVAQLREGLGQTIGHLTARVDGHERAIDKMREDWIRFDEREKVRRERRRDGLEVGGLTVQRWQLILAAGIGGLTVIASIANVIATHF